MMQVQQQSPAVDTRAGSKLDSLIVGVGIFSATNDVAPMIISVVPVEFSSHDWSPDPDRAVEDDIRKGRSFMIDYPPEDLFRAGVAENVVLPEPLAREGYRKYFVLDVAEPSFLSMMWQLATRRKTVEPTLPEGRASGFLGATWLKEVTGRELLGAASQQCIHRCNPPSQCRQIGCFCNRALKMCV
jgi:hypothetical protein